MKLKYTHADSITATNMPGGDQIAWHAAAAFGHVLNTSDRVGREHTAKDFAQAIREVYSEDDLNVAAIIAHLENLPE